MTSFVSLPDIGGCAQNPIREASSFELAYPQDATETTALMDTSVAPSVGPTIVNYSRYVPFMPTAVYPPGVSATVLAEAPYNYLKDPINFYATTFSLPSYIDTNNITSLSGLLWCKPLKP